VTIGTSPAVDTLHLVSGEPADLEFRFEDVDGNPVAI